MSLQFDRARKHAGGVHRAGHGGVGADGWERELAEFLSMEAEQGTVTPNDRVKFATYTRDGETGIDYAMNRYYNSGTGRFLTPDPFNGSGNPSNPVSWNPYAYMNDSPVNGNDPRGLIAGIPGGPGGPGFGDPNDVGCEDLSTWMENFFDFGSNPMGGLYGDLNCSLFSGYASFYNPQMQSGGGGTIIKIKGLSTTSKKALQVQNELRALQKSIDADPTCDRWLAGVDNAISYMLGTAAGSTGMMVGVGSFNQAGINAVAGTGGTSMTPGSMLITVNVNGAFFNSSVSAGYGLPATIVGGSPVAQAAILLHELAHDVGAAGFQDNDQGIAAQTQNNQLVMQNCGGVVNGPPGGNQ